ncbi:hypothetical protein GX50_08855 [[Emmonsia] crescens]|uniref:Uncharacterized protein n=1 Tax=[Emmonsia] crescens TaxID=73230 RepID=A0A2B7Z6F7_9EURO|nr:hypothetical protein GX50_08855 [Emmonsia crescens]
MNQTLKQAIRWAAGQAPRSNPVKRKNTRIIVSNFADDPALATHGDFIGQNTAHTSHNDSRPHITLHIKTADMTARKTTRAVHIYSKNDKEEEYESFRLFEERSDKESDGTPGDQVE